MFQEMSDDQMALIEKKEASAPLFLLLTYKQILVNDNVYKIT
jgi:hypothetical protein